MYYYGARYYDPRISIFVSVDPLAEKTMESYLYTGNNPIMFTDPTGMGKEGGGDPPPPSVRQAIFAARFPNIAKGIGTFQSGATNITTNSVRFTLNAKGLQGNSGWEGSQINAFRHTLWQAAITTKYGSNVAKNAGDMHEANPYVDYISGIKGTYGGEYGEYNGKKHYQINQSGDTVIDLNNNEIGRMLGGKRMGNSTKNLALDVLDYFYNQGLYTATQNDDGTFSISKTKISESQYKEARSSLLSTDVNGYTPSDLNKIKSENDAKFEKIKNESQTLKGGSKW